MPWLVFNQEVTVRITTTPLRVLWRGTYSAETDQGDSRIAFKSGQLVEHVKLMDESTGELYDWTLGEHINGQVKSGDVIEVAAECSAQVAVGHSRSGREYTTTKYKFKVVDAKPAKLSAPAAATA